MDRTEKNDFGIKLGLLVFNPILGLLSALRDIKSNSSFVVFFLFCVLFGISFTVPNNRDTGYSGDGVAYRIKFERIAKYDTGDFNHLYNDYIKFDEGNKDFYMLSASFLVSRFTDNYHWLFGLYAVIFAFFMLKSLRFLTNHINFTYSLYSFLLATMFVMSNPIFNINGVRFWTAAWIGVYCLFQIFRNGNKRYLLLALLTPIVHISFLLFIAILLIALFLRKNDKFWIFIFVLSFFVSELSILLFESAENYLPEFLARIIKLYTDPTTLAEKQEQRVWYAFIFQIPGRVIVNLMIFFFYKKRAMIKESPVAFNMYQFLLVWMTFVNFTMLIPSVGIRFFQLGIPILAYIWLAVFSPRGYFKWIIAFCLCLAPVYAYLINLTFEVTELQFYLTNSIFLIYDYLFAS